MKRLFAIGLFGAFLCCCPPLRAEDVPHLDFVRGLREKHYPDLALEYLKKLSQNPPADIAPLIPLEMARTRLDLAAATTDTTQRLTHYQDATNELQAFIKNNPQNPLASGARLELARVTVLQGRTQLSKALREETKAARQAEADKARVILESAGEQLKTVNEEIEARLAKMDNPQTPKDKQEKAQLEVDRIRAELDRGLNYLDQRQTYIDESKEEVLRAQNDIVQLAMPFFQKATERDRNQPLCWEAEAWWGRCLVYSGKPPEARKKFANIISSKEKAAESGKRLARYFLMLVILESPQTDEKPDTVRLQATQWVKDYANFLNTPEGFGVRYLLADATVKHALSLMKPADRAPFFATAKNVCKELEQTENEFMHKARRLKISVIKEEGGLNQAVKDLATFDDCFIRAQFEAEMIEEDTKKITDADKQKEARDKRLKTVIEALNRGFNLVETKKQKVPEEDLNTAKVMLTYTYWTSNQLKDAIRVGEELARLKTRPPQSSQGAMYALMAHSQLVTEAEKGSLKPEELKAIKDRFRDFAEFVKKTWPNDQPGDVARHEIALRLMREENYPAAVEELASIKPNYSSIILVRYQLALAALEADKAKLKPIGADKRSFEERALDALQNMPPLPAGAEPTTNYTYMLAKLKLGQHLFAAKKYAEMEKMATPLQARLPQLKFPTSEAADEISLGLSAILLYARYGRAETEYAAGHYAKVSEILDPVLKEAKGGKLQELKKNLQLRGALLGLALRANIQDGKTDMAGEVLDILDSYSADDPQLVGGGSSQTLVQLAALINLQVEEIRKKGNADQMAKTVASFSGFLDKLLAKAKATALTPETLILLAQCYSNLGTHKRAAELLAGVEPPKDGADQKTVDRWRYVRIMYVRELRLDKQIEPANKELKNILGTDKEPGWGAKNMDAQKERIFLLEEEGKYGAAAVQWDALIKAIQKNFNAPGMKEQYLECYYHLTNAQYKNGVNNPDPAKKTAIIKQAAGFITNLESKMPDFGGEASQKRFTDLLEKEPMLKEQYELLKKGPAK
jgi:tetratricopeptide (TPR) repeat protein